VRSSFSDARNDGLLLVTSIRVRANTRARRSGPNGDTTNGDERFRRDRPSVLMITTCDGRARNGAGHDVIITVARLR